MQVVVSQFEGIEATPVLPLAAGCLVASARADPMLARATRFAIELERKPIADAVAAYDRPDVLGFSLYPWNTAYSLAVAAAAREVHRDCLIVCGGPSVPRRPERAARFLEEHPAIDVLVFAEGEQTFRDLLRAQLAGQDFDEIGGIAVRGRGDRDGFTTLPGRVRDFSPTASPYLDGTFDELYERHRARFTMALCETNRGCPFSCTFCDWSLTKRVVEFPLERVHAELEWVARHGFRHVMLSDANFGIRPRDADIARYLVELKERTGSPSTFYFYLTKNDHGRNLETIDILQAGGIGTWVGLAVQDFDDGVLAAVKRDNIQTGEAMKLRDICAERGIPTFNELILGLPGQTYASFTETIATAMPPTPRHDFVLFLCRMIENAELGDPESRARFGIETRRCRWKTSTVGWDPVVDEIQEVVVATNDLPLADWRRAFRFAFLAAALYNLRLLRVVLQHVVGRGGVARRDYLVHLCDRLAEAPAGSVCAELHETLESYVESLLGGGSLVLPIAGAAADAAPVHADEAVAIAALRRFDDFLTEIEHGTRGFLAERGVALDTLAEAFRFQGLITPRWGVVEPSVVTLDHDWPAHAAGEALAARPTTVRYVPPSYVPMPRFETFAVTHLGCVRAGLETSFGVTLNS